VDPRNEEPRLYGVSLDPVKWLLALKLQPQTA
jgi:hypothetical protein